MRPRDGKIESYIRTKLGEGRMATGVRSPKKFLGTRLFRARKTPFLNREGTTKKGTFALLLEGVVT